MIIVDNTPIENPFNAEKLGSEINERIFLAINNLIKEEEFRSPRSFCLRHNFNYQNVMRLSYPEYNRKPTFELLFVLSHFYKVNLNWIVTGIGEWKLKK
jgi:hypothetical protein